MLRITRRPLKLGNSVCHGKSGKEKKGAEQPGLLEDPGSPQGWSRPVSGREAGRSRGSTGRGAGAGGPPETWKGPIPSEAP